MNQPITIQQLDKSAAPPYDLLLHADPSKVMINLYWADSVALVAMQQHQVIGIIVLLALSTEILEIKNLAVEPSWQGKGIGTQLIVDATTFAESRGYLTLCIGTANSSFQQLRLYQKLGFQPVSVRKNFFPMNYPEPIFENGIQATDMIMLSKELARL